MRIFNCIKVKKLWDPTLFLDECLKPVVVNKSKYLQICTTYLEDRIVTTCLKSTTSGIVPTPKKKVA